MGPIHDSPIHMCCASATLGVLLYLCAFLLIGMPSLLTSIRKISAHPESTNSDVNGIILVKSSLFSQLELFLVLCFHNIVTRGLSYSRVYAFVSFSNLSVTRIPFWMYTVYSTVSDIHSVNKYLWNNHSNKHCARHVDYRGEQVKVPDFVRLTVQWRVDKCLVNKYLQIIYLLNIKLKQPLITY